MFPYNWCIIQSIYFIVYSHFILVLFTLELAGMRQGLCCGISGNFQKRHNNHVLRLHPLKAYNLHAYHALFQLTGVLNIVSWDSFVITRNLLLSTGNNMHTVRSVQSTQTMFFVKTESKIFLYVFNSIATSFSVSIFRFCCWSVPVQFQHGRSHRVSLV